MTTHSDDSPGPRDVGGRAVDDRVSITPYPDRTDGDWAVWNGSTPGNVWAWTVVASPDGVSHQNIWPGPKTVRGARGLAAALNAAATWCEQVEAGRSENG